MARPPKPTAVHELSGAYTKNPQRRRKNEAVPKAGIGPYPKKQSTVPAKIWDELVNMIVPGVLGDCDRAYLSVVCNLLSQYRRDPDEFSAAKLTILMSSFGKLGMNPIDRIKMVVPAQEEKAKPEDEFF